MQSWSKNCTWTCFIAGYSSRGFFSGFFTSLINQLHQLALLFKWNHLRKATPVLRMICYYYYYCFEQFENSFCNSSSCCDMIQELSSLNYFCDACMWSRTIAVEDFFASFVCSIKTQTDPQFETDRNMQESKKKIHTRDWRWWQQNEFLESCTHNVLTIYQSYEILSPLTYSDPPPTLLEFFQKWLLLLIYNKCFIFLFFFNPNFWFFVSYVSIPKRDLILNIPSFVESV